MKRLCETGKISVNFNRFSVGTMEFDKWAEQVTNHLNEHANAIRELTLISKELLKEIDTLKMQSPNNMEKKHD